MQLPDIPSETKSKWLSCFWRVIRDDLRLTKRTSDTLDAAEITRMLLGWASIPTSGSIAYLVQSFIPGVRNLYPWAFPVIVAIAVIAIHMFVIAVRYRARLDFGGPHNRDKLIRSAWDLHDSACALMQVNSDANRRQFEQTKNKIWGELSVAGRRYDPRIRQFIVITPSAK